MSFGTFNFHSATIKRLTGSQRVSRFGISMVTAERNIHSEDRMRDYEFTLLKVCG